MDRPEPEMGTDGEVLGARIVAFVIDTIITGVAMLVLVFLLGLIGAGLGGENGLAAAMVLIIPLLIVVQFGYFIYFEGNSGQTPGKKLMNVMVAKEDGSACDYGDAAIRNVLRIVDQLGIVIPYLVGLIVMFVTDDHQRIGDIVADTVVVRAK